MGHFRSLGGRKLQMGRGVSSKETIKQYFETYTRNSRIDSEKKKIFSVLKGSLKIFISQNRKF